MIWASEIESPIGRLYALCTDNGLTALSFEPLDTPERVTGESHPILDLLSEELQAYFMNSLKAFSVPLTPKGTDFQLKVWNALQKVPFGSTRSYLEQSKIVGDPKSIRAVARANGQNPIAIVIPCHRIVGSDGTLTGYAGGLWRKKYLLELESEQQQLF